MGASITLEAKNGDEFYFRDSYNATNLAWIIDLSYWQNFNLIGKESPSSRSESDNLSELGRGQFTDFLDNHEIENIRSCV